MLKDKRKRENVLFCLYSIWHAVLITYISNTISKDWFDIVCAVITLIGTLFLDIYLFWSSYQKSEREEEKKNKEQSLLRIKIRAKEIEELRGSEKAKRLCTYILDSKKTLSEKDLFIMASDIKRCCEETDILIQQLERFSMG